MHHRHRHATDASTTLCTSLPLKVSLIQRSNRSTSRQCIKILIAKENALKFYKLKQSST